MAKVSIRNLYKIYPNAKDVAPAVRDFNLEIDDSEFIVFVGPSGCGKTTTLRMIAGLESISKGQIYIDDQLVNHLPPKKRNIAMVFQNYALYPNLTLFENMAFSLRLKKMEKFKINETIKSKSRKLQIEHLLDRLPGNVSGGQRQRVALGRAIVRDPKIFLMDEPLSNLDAKMRVHMRLEIIKLQRELKATTIYVTHDQVEAMTMGDRIVVMNEGAIQQVDTPENIYNYPANRFVAGFIGSPAMNFFKGEIIQTEKGLLFSHPRFHLNIQKEMVEHVEKYSGRVLYGGIRPENLSLKIDNGEKLDGKSLRGIVDVTELVGADRYVYVKVGTEEIVVRVAANERFENGMSVRVSVEMDSFLFFDSSTGARIG
ncbi:MAG: sn-glycerol-3-phosphate ABC transporter ATP-binding protein UgpC [Bacillota bacterium]|nr:sn-glycerol-3-phosphate ABC transporter ATP-binding protein UgpC [Bacillota bacterium]